MFINKNGYYKIEEFDKLGIGAIYSDSNSGNLSPYLLDTELSKKNRLKLLKKLKIENRKLVYAKQTHSDNIIILESDCMEFYDDVDGFITKEKDIVIFTQYADCLPIYFYDKKQKIIGLCHSGWLGTYKGIGLKMLDIFIDKYKSNKEDLLIGIGIGIKDCCYEVQKDFYDKFLDRFEEKIVEKSFSFKNGKIYYNNELFNYLQFKDKGIKNLIKSDICTYCDGEFNSYRRDGKNSGRNGAFIYFK